MSTPANPLHSAVSSRWFTPVSVIEAARCVLGGIGFDPCSEREAQERVRATWWASEEDESLLGAWDFGEPVSVLLNPPGGLTRAFWQKLQTEIDAGHVRHAIYVAFSISQLQTLQYPDRESDFLGAPEFPVCIPNRRLKFDRPESMGPADSPTQSNALIYLPGTTDESGLFYREFGAFGNILAPKGWSFT